MSDNPPSTIPYTPDPTFGAPRNRSANISPAPDALNQVKKGFKRFFSLRKKAAKKATEQQAEPAPAATAAPVAAAAASETPAAKPTAPAATPDSAPGMTLSYQFDAPSRV